MLPFQTRLTQTKPVLSLSNEHGSQVKDQGRRQCCHNKHKKISLSAYTWCIFTFWTRLVLLLVCSWKIDSCPPLQVNIIFLIYFLICPVTVEDTVYGNTWHMHVRATPSIVNEKVLEKTVPVIVASGPRDPFASKFDLTLCETDSNCQKCETPAEPVKVFLLLLVKQIHTQSQYTFWFVRSSSIFLCYVIICSS